MTPLFEAIVKHCPPPDVDENGPLQLQVSQLDYSSYVGAIGIGRIKRGKIRRNSPVVVVDREGKVRNERIMQVLGFLGLDRVEVDEASAGDIVAFAGIEYPEISDTICDPTTPEALPPLVVDEPTISMTFEVNNSPFCGREGKYVTSRQIRERLLREVMHNVALRVEETDDPDKFRVYGRGELHLGVLLENMRREGYELAVSRPRVVVKEIDGQTCEPYETLAVDLDESSQGCGDAGARRARRPADRHASRRQGARAPRLHDSIARSDRLPDRFPHDDVGHRASCITSSITSVRCWIARSASARTAC